MIHEGVIVTCGEDGAPHITPLGFERTDAVVVLRPFVPSATLANLRQLPRAVMNLTDDVRVTAGCLTGRRDWPLAPAVAIPGWRLADVLTHLELEVEDVEEDARRPVFRCRIVHEQAHRPWTGFNRARAAVIEAAILVSRLDFIGAAKLEAEMTYLHIAVRKTGGAAEHCAWNWLLDAVAAHSRQFFDVDTLR